MSSTQAAAKAAKFAAKAAKLGGKGLLKKAAAGKGAVAFGKGAALAGKGAAAAGKAGVMLMKGAGIFMTAAATVNVTENLLTEEGAGQHDVTVIDTSTDASDDAARRLGWLGPVLEVYQKLRRQQLAAAGISTGGSSSSSSRFGARFGGSQGGEGGAHVGCTAAAAGGAGGEDVDATQLFNQILSRGSYQLKVEADLQQHRIALEALAASIAAFKPSSMTQLVEFVSNAQQQLLDQLYDERAVLKHIADWPAAKWEAMWEAVVVYGQMLELQQMCLRHQALAGSSSSKATSLADAAAAAQKTYSHVVSKLEAFQRQESAFVKRMRAQGVPWNSSKLVAAVKEASVALGTCYVSAVLGMLAEAEGKLLAQMEKEQAAAAAAAAAAAVVEAPAGSTAAAAGPAAAAAAGSAVKAAAMLWGCEVRDPKQQQRLQQRSARQLAQHKQRREQQLHEAVSFVFKLHQFAGGLDEECRDVFLQLVQAVEASA
ncbi:hypothetical protein OEZ85_007565 [Tetradesmus obliquus]|uniref:DUF4456 domain-containing protein n=1 Tax=Tetradesmus obliquus TaxID=3088 RepID=A0ABY8TKT0_TETOB|nr:hypothetical protein OEZ85_007565 [Tetradesmus obliquus]